MAEINPHGRDRQKLVREAVRLLADISNDETSVDDVVHPIVADPLAGWLESILNDWVWTSDSQRGWAHEVSLALLRTVDVAGRDGT